MYVHLTSKTPASFVLINSFVLIMWFDFYNIYLLLGIKDF